MMVLVSRRKVQVISRVCVVVVVLLIELFCAVLKYFKEIRFLKICKMWKRALETFLMV